MTFKILAAAALAMTMAAPAHAVPVEVDLIIDNLFRTDTTTQLTSFTTIVTLFGLDNGIPGDQAATSFSIRTAFDFYGPFAKVDVEDTTTVNNFNFIPGGNFAFNNLVKAYPSEAGFSTC
jgi:hypothetical protein